MKRTSSQHTVDILFVLVLFCTFAASVLMVLLMGAGSYKHIVQVMDRHYEERTVLAYLEAKVHHYDNDGGIYVTQYQGNNVLALEEKVDGSSYVTLVYFYDDAVRELFMEDGLDLDLSAGQMIMPVNDFVAEQISDRLIRLTCVGKSGNSNELYLYIRSEGGES